MTQYVINIGAVPNDGTGDPLRTAFNEVNLNFDQVWATGLVGSNIAVANNTIRTTNTNGNLVLAPNGVGIVQSNVSILPNTPNIRSLGSAAYRWDTIYVQYANISGNLDLAGEFSVGDMTVTGNLTVTGNTIQIGNIVTETLTIQLANAASTANAANGSGITVGANDNIATLLYSSTSNTWNTNIGVSATGNVTGSNVLTGGVVSATGNVRGANFNTVGAVSAVGNITGNYFIGNGSQLTGLSLSTGNIGFTGDAIYDLNGIILENADLSHAATAAVVLPANGDANAIQVNNTYGNIALQTGAGSGITASWSFDNNGDLTFPDNSGDGWPVNTQRFGMGNIGAWLDGQWTIGEFSGNTVSGEFGIRIDPSIEGPVGMTFPASASSNTQPVQIYSTNGSGIELYTGSNNWVFGADGSVIFPTLTVDLHNGGTQTGQTLQFGDPTQQAIITGPTPAVDNNAQRLIIQGQRGNGTGEGGDVYLWAGDAENNGGDIKIYAGDADAGNVGDLGGYVNIDGGAGYTRGGQVEITGGYSSSGDGGYVNLNGGYGTNGGNVGIQAGYGQAGPGGAVTIQGGASNNGVTEYGNVGISAGASSWAFDNTGNLTLPNTGVIYETLIPFGGLEGKTIALKPSGGTNADQQLLVYPTAGVDFNHLHLTTGNLWNTEMFLGNDDFYVKLANTGNIVINTNDSIGNTAQWTFGTEGTVLNSGNLTIQTPNGVPGAVTAITGSSGSWESNPVTDLPTTGGNGTGLTVNVTQEGGYAGTIAIATPGDGYNNGDTITVTSGSSSATFTISVLANGWTFDTVGNLHFPSGGYIGAAGVKGDGTMLTGGKGNIASLTSYYANVDALNYSSCVTANPDGTLNITTYGDGTGQLGQWVFSGGNLTVPGISTGEGTGEIQTITGSRRSIGITNDPDFAYAATFAGHSEFGNVAFTASTGQVQSIKVTFVIQTNGVAFNWEQFDVASTKLDGANAFVSVSNRVRSNSAIDYTDVSAYVNEGGAIEIRLNPPDGQTVAYVNYDAVEFNLFLD